MIVWSKTSRNSSRLINHRSEWTFNDISKSNVRAQFNIYKCQKNLKSADITFHFAKIDSFSFSISLFLRLYCPIFFQRYFDKKTCWYLARLDKFHVDNFHFRFLLKPVCTNSMVFSVKMRCFFLMPSFIA